MKTSEFIKYFEGEGFTVKYLNEVFKVHDRHNKTVLILEKEMVNTRFIDFLTMPEEVKQEINIIIFEYLMTPIEEREEEKKYYLKQKGVEDNHAFLNYNRFDDRYFTNNKKEHGQYITQFTQSEIDNLPEYYTHPAVWEQIEVGVKKNVKDNHKN